MINLQAAADALTKQQQRDEEVRRTALIAAYWKLATARGIAPIWVGDHCEPAPAVPSSKEPTE